MAVRERHNHMEVPSVVANGLRHKRGPRNCKARLSLQAVPAAAIIVPGFRLSRLRRLNGRTHNVLRPADFASLGR